MQRRAPAQYVVFLMAALTFWLAEQTPSHAALYHFIDKAGVHHFTNVPDDPRYRPYGQTRQRTRRPQSGFPGDAKRLDRVIKSAARRHNLDPSLIKAIIKVESNFNPQAVSPRGARGLMQLMPETIKQMGVADPFDPAENIHAGTRYLRMLLDTFHDRLSLSLAAYNAGPALVKKKGRIPAIKETRNYVKKVLATYRDYKQ